MGSKAYKDEGLRIWLKAAYVDDVRNGTSVLGKGKRWNNTEKVFEYRSEWEEEDEKAAAEGESNTKRMAKVMNKVMDSITPNLKFEMEIAEDFEGKVLPTLDFDLRVERLEDGRSKLRYKFYEKKVNSKYCILERSSMSEKGKISSLTQDLIRRMVNTDGETSVQERNTITEKFISRLRVSGYKKPQVKEIIQCGLKGYLTKVENAKKEGRDLHRPASSTLALRQRKKLTEKTSCYKGGKKDGKVEENVGLGEGWKNENVTSKKTVVAGRMETRAVLFIPGTKGGELASRLRKEEEELSKLTGYRVKIVERSGLKISSMLHRSNPWADDPCRREDCMVCASEDGGCCTIRNVVYKTSCLECKKDGKVSTYYGETSTSLYERGQQHLDDYDKMEDDSHMIKHHVIHHGDREEKLEFGFKVVKGHTSAFARQIHEAIMIEMNKEGGVIMNSKGGYNRCRLPRLTVMMGSMEMRDKEEACQDISEKEIENAIINMRRKRKIRKASVDPDEIGPVKKKRRRRNYRKYEIGGGKKRNIEKEETEIEMENGEERRKKKSKLMLNIETECDDKLSQVGVVCDKTDEVNDSNVECSDVYLESRLHHKEKICSKVFDATNISLEKNENLNNNEILNPSSPEQEITEKNEKVFKFTACLPDQKEKPKLRNFSEVMMKNSEIKANPKPSKRKAIKWKQPPPPNFNYRPLKDYFKPVKMTPEDSLLISTKTQI